MNVIRTFIKVAEIWLMTKRKSTRSFESTSYTYIELVRAQSTYKTCKHFPIGCEETEIEVACKGHVTVEELSQLHPTPTAPFI